MITPEDVQQALAQLREAAKEEGHSADHLDTSVALQALMAREASALFEQSANENDRAPDAPELEEMAMGGGD